MKFTIFGGNGFIGRALSTWLLGGGHEVTIPNRGTNQNLEHLGHVIYAIGLTADFRTRPFETVEAHVSLMGRLLRESMFESWTYLSSTRVYAGLGEGPVNEQVALHVRPDADGLYNLSKLTGEALCLAQPRPEIRVVRLANVYGPGQGSESFLGSLLADYANNRPMIIAEAAQSSKDYVAVDDVCKLIELIATHGRDRLYNLASGEPVTHGALADHIGSLTSRRVEFAPNGQVRRFPAIDIARIVAEFEFRPRRLLDNLDYLVGDDGRSIR